jgi:hypothetical protein
MGFCHPFYQPMHVDMFNDQNVTWPGNWENVFIIRYGYLTKTHVSGEIVNRHGNRQ